MACVRAYVYCWTTTKWKQTHFSTGLHNSTPNKKKKRTKIAKCGTLRAYVLPARVAPVNALNWRFPIEVSHSRFANDRFLFSICSTLRLFLPKKKKRKSKYSLQKFEIKRNGQTNRELYAAMMQSLLVLFDLDAECRFAAGIRRRPLDF